MQLLSCFLSMQRYGGFSDRSAGRVGADCFGGERVKAVAFLQSVRLLNRQLSLLVSDDVAYWHFSDLDRCPSRGRKAHLGSAGGADTARPRTTITNSAAMSPEKLSQTTSYSPIQVCYILLKVGEHAGAVCVRF